jgi:hypothetical protein
MVWLTAAPALGAEGPLLVVVEAPPELSVDASEVRRAIGTELHDATVAPDKLVSETSDRALVVSVDRERITMSLRDSLTGPVTRAIPAPGEREARVHAIAWLAGNLVRDQVTGIVAETVAPAPAPASTPVVAAGPPVPAPAAAPLATEPPPYQPPPALVLATAAEPPPPRWFVSLEAGPVLGVYNLVAPGDGTRNSPYNPAPQLATLWRLELRRFSSDHRFLLGVSAEGTTGYYSPEAFGAAGFGGWSRHKGSWQMEATLGLGLDFGPRQDAAVTTSIQSSTQGLETSRTVVSGGLAGGVYGVAAAAISHPVGESTNLFLRLGAHLSAVETDDLFIWAALGVSYGVW